MYVWGLPDSEHQRMTLHVCIYMPSCVFMCSWFLCAAEREAELASLIMTSSHLCTSLAPHTGEQSNTFSHLVFYFSTECIYYSIIVLFISSSPTVVTYFSFYPPLFWTVSLSMLLTLWFTEDGHHCSGSAGHHDQDYWVSAAEPRWHKPAVKDDDVTYCWLAGSPRSRC